MKVRSEIEMSSATWYWLPAFLTCIFLLIYFIWLWKIARRHPQCCLINWTGFVIFIFPKGQGSPFGSSSSTFFPWFPSKSLTLCWYQDVQMLFFLPWVCLVRLLAPQCWRIYELQNSPGFYCLHGIVMQYLINHTPPHLAFLLSRALHNPGDQWQLCRIWKDADGTTQSLSHTELVPKLPKQGEQGVWGISCPDRDKILQECAPELSFPWCRQRIHR